MEAAERSGTLITSRLALEENRLLFALPGDVTRHNSRGTNRLIREGAILIQDGVDILRELAPQLRGILANWNLQDHVPESEEQDLRPGSTITKQSRNTPKETAAPSPTAPIQPELPGLAADAGQQTQPPNLEPELRTILGFILHEPLQFDDLAGLSREAGIPTGRLSSHLLKLELLGLVRQLPGRIYAAL
jgi:predicted Rossmann fold nucleotide-binding protein DprA/Smf involved in DNA uptake